MEGGGKGEGMRLINPLLIRCAETGWGAGGWVKEVGGGREGGVVWRREILLNSIEINHKSTINPR